MWGCLSKIASRASDLVLNPGGQFSLSESQGNGTTILTIAPNQPTLGAGANTTVAVKGILNNIFNFTAGGFNETAPSLVLLSPSVDANLTQMTSSHRPPDGRLFRPDPSGFTAPAHECDGAHLHDDADGGGAPGIRGVPRTSTRAARRLSPR